MKTKKVKLLNGDEASALFFRDNEIWFVARIKPHRWTLYHLPSGHAVARAPGDGTRAHWLPLFMAIADKLEAMPIDWAETDIEKVRNGPESQAAWDYILGLKHEGVIGT